MCVVHLSACRSPTRKLGVVRPHVGEPVARRAPDEGLQGLRHGENAGMVLEVDVDAIRAALVVAEGAIHTAREVAGGEDLGVDAVESGGAKAAGVRTKERVEWHIAFGEEERWVVLRLFVFASKIVRTLLCPRRLFLSETSADRSARTHTMEKSR